MSNPDRTPSLDLDLEDFFAAARHSDAARPLPQGFAAACLGDAAASLAAAQARRPAPTPPARPGLRQALAALAGLFGGAPGLAGACAASLAAFWIGFAQPGAITGLIPATAISGEEASLFPDPSSLFAEE